MCAALVKKIHCTFAAKLHASLVSVSTLNPDSLANVSTNVHDAKLADKGGYNVAIPSGGGEGAYL